MSVINIDEHGAYERELEQNWAAAYAKRLVAELERKHDEDKTVIEASLEAMSADIDERVTGAQLDDAVDNIESELGHYAPASDLSAETAARIAAVGSEAAARISKDNELADGTALGDKCIYSRHIREGNVTTEKIHDGDVTAAKLANGAVTGAKLADGAVSSGKLADEAVTALKIADGAVSSLGLADNCVTTDKLGIGAVIEGKIASGAVTEGKLASNAVTTGKIANGAVTAAKLASDVFASGAETGYGGEAYKAVSPKGLKQGIGGILPASVSYGDFAIDNIPIDSINEDVTSIFHNPVRDAGLREYSATPQRVGTWVDGTPIWRVALPYIPMEHGVRHLMLSLSRYTVSVYLGDLLSDYISDNDAINSATIVDNKISCALEYAFHQTAPRVWHGIIIFTTDSDSEYADMIDDRNGKWGGIIEFTCPEEYIITGDE